MISHLSINTLKIFRKLYKIIFKPNNKLNCEMNPKNASELFFNTLSSDNSCMIARFGATELTCILNYLGVKKNKRDVIGFIQGRSQSWWWEPAIIDQMQRWSGFFPPQIDKIEQFCELMLQDKAQVDILGSWLNEEKFLEDGMNATKVHLRFLEPFWSGIPWTKALEGKKVLVVHPFSQTILKQYEKRELLFANKDILPEFKSLTVIQAVQSLGGNNDMFEDWFQALDFMKLEIDKVDYDVCLIGAGAYGFPLAAHVKGKGKKAIHMGGALQLLFGIRGKRWEDPEYGVSQWGIPRGFYSNMMNEHWVRPNEDEKPVIANKVEGACYW